MLCVLVIYKHYVEYTEQIRFLRNYVPISICYTTIVEFDVLGRSVALIKKNLLLGTLLKFCKVSFQKNPCSMVSKIDCIMKNSHKTFVFYC